MKHRSSPHSIRDGLKQDGVLGKGEPLHQHIPLQWTEAQTKDIANYQPEQVLVFHRSSHGIEKHDALAVTGTAGDSLRTRNQRGEDVSMSLTQARSFSVHENRAVVCPGVIASPGKTAWLGSAVSFPFASIRYVLDQFGSHVRDAFTDLSNQMAQMRERKQKLEGELRRLAATAAETGPSAFLVEAINEREKQLRELSDQLLAGGENSVDAYLTDIRNFILGKIGDLRALMAGDPAPARKELLKHVSEIRMMPQQAGDGKSHYVAKGEWRLLGNQQDALKTLEPAYREIRVVAGACNASNLLVIPFSRSLAA